MARALSHEEQQYFRQAGEVFGRLNEAHAFAVPAALQDESAFAALIDQAGDPETAIRMAVSGLTPSSEPEAPAAPTVDEYRIDFDPFSGALPSVEQYASMTAAERDALEAVRESRSGTVAEQMQAKMAYEDASQRGAQRRMAEAEQARLEADPAYQRAQMMNLAMRASGSWDMQDLVAKAAAAGVLDTSSANPREWRVTEEGRAALPDAYQAERLEAAVGRLRTVQRHAVGMSSGFDVASGADVPHRVEVAPAAPTE